jgi:hypothetical protein
MQYSNLIISVEILLDPLEDVVAGEVGEHALVEVGAAAAAQVIDVVNVHWNLPDARKGFCRTGKFFFEYWETLRKEGNV